MIQIDPVHQEAQLLGYPTLPPYATCSCPAISVPGQVAQHLSTGVLKACEERLESFNHEMARDLLIGDMICDGVGRCIFSGTTFIPLQMVGPLLERGEFLKQS